MSKLVYNCSIFKKRIHLVCFIRKWEIKANCRYCVSFVRIFYVHNFYNKFETELYRATFSAISIGKDMNYDKLLLFMKTDD